MRTFLSSWSGNRPFTGKLALILVAALLAHAASLLNGFVWDDWELVVGNDAYRTFDLRAIIGGRANALEYLPVRDLSLTLDALLWGERPFGYHLTNVLIYLSSLAVFGTALLRLAGISGHDEPERLALWSTLLFAVHPLHVEVVSWITARNTLLASLFLFLSLQFVVRWRGERKGSHLALSALFYVLACFSKAIVLFFPAVVALVLWGPGRSALAGRNRVAGLALFGAIATSAAVVHGMNAADSGIMSEGILRPGTSSFLWSLAKAVQIPWFYLRQFTVPYPLSVQYAVSFTQGPLLARSLGAGAALACAVWLTWSLRRTRPLFAFGLAWFLLSLVPVLNIFPTHPVVADRYAFLAVAGVIIGAVSMVSTMSQHRTAAGIGMVLIALLWSGLTVARTLAWRSDSTLWLSARKVDPHAPRTNLAQALWREGRYDEALEELRDDHRRTGTYQYSYYQGLLREREGRLSEAVRLFRRALVEGGDTDRSVQLSLAKLYERTGDYRSALDHYLRTLETESIDPNGRKEYEARAGAARMRERFAQQVRDAQAAAARAPRDREAQTSLAVLQHMLGLYGEAEHGYRKALSIGPGSWQLWYNLALVLKKQGRCGEAVEAFGRSLVIRQDNVDALNNQALCLVRLRRYPEAEHAFQSALEHRPDFYYAAFNLARMYFARGDLGRAQTYFLRTKSLAADDPAVASRVDTYLAQLDVRRDSGREGGDR